MVSPSSLVFAYAESTASNPRFAYYVRMFVMPAEQDLKKIRSEDLKDLMIRAYSLRTQKTRKSLPFKLVSEMVSNSSFTTRFST